MDSIVTTTLKDFPFRADHCLPLRTGAAGERHQHTYVAWLEFATPPGGEPIDQDTLGNRLERQFAHLHGSYLNEFFMDKTTDEDLAAMFLRECRHMGCFEVVLYVDGHRASRAKIAP